MKYRSNEPELMDDLNLSSTQLIEALKDISRVNRLLGGHSITLDGVYALVQGYPEHRHFTIVDVGCGDGSQLRELALFLRKKQVNFSLIGIDINEKSLAIGRKLSIDYPEISFRNQDILTLTREDLQCDIISTTLTLHHFTDQEILIFMKQFYELCSLGIIVNDLVRSRLAYFLFKVFSRFFITSAVAKNDGLVSIERGFKKEELQQLATTLQFENDLITWKWAFRYLWVVYKS